MARIRSPDIISSPNMHAIKSCPRKSKLATFIFLSVDKCVLELSYQIENVSAKWELPSLLLPSFTTRGRIAHETQLLFKWNILNLRGHHNKALFKSMLLNVKGANHSIKETFITSKSIFPWISNKAMKSMAIFNLLSQAPTILKGLIHHCYLPQSFCLHRPLPLCMTKLF